MTAARTSTAVTALRVKALLARVDAVSAAKYNARRQAAGTTKEPPHVKEARAVLSAWDKRLDAEDDKRRVADNRRVQELRNLVTFGDIDKALAEVEKEEKRMGI